MMSCAENDHAEALVPPPANAVVVVPVYNEAENVHHLIERLLALPCGVDVLIVDDKSPDGTAGIVQAHPEIGRRVFLLSRNGPRGFAHACKDGFQWAVDHGYAVCLEMDADFSHDPDDVPRLLEAIADGADVALGSRYVGGIRVLNWPVRRLLLSLFAGSYTRFWSGLRLSDPTSGFKAIRTRVIRSLDWSQFVADGYGFIIEFHFLAARLGFTIREVPIVFTERRVGASKMSFKIMRESATRVLKLAAYRMAHPQAYPARTAAEAPHFA
jgi:dolichol-phosphate mannosyltransferase